MSAFQKQSSGSSWGVWICLVSFYGGAKDFISTWVFLRRITFFIKIEMFWHRIFSIFQKQPPEVFLKIFAEFTGKQLCQILSFNEVAGLRPAGLWSQACNFIKRENLEQVFSCEFCEAFKNSFFTEHLRTAASDFFTGSQVNSWKAIIHLITLKTYS